MMDFMWLALSALSSVGLLLWWWRQHLNSSWENQSTNRRMAKATTGKWEVKTRRDDQIGRL